MPVLRYDIREDKAIERVSMDTNISVYVEKRDKSTGKWSAMSVESDVVYSDVNYGLFGLLAGVRSDSGMLQPIRGLPSDVSAELEDAYGKYDYFAATYYDFCELELVSYMMSEMMKVMVECGLANRNCEDYMLNMCGVEIADSISYNLSQFDSLSTFVTGVKRFIEKSDGIDSDSIVPNEYRIVIWFDD